ncbi:hypothetical protein [Pseudonocardia spinosispora]|uniref:hypothetical protein n=1 Tax=Pseudonocardia spinosispora TaxID=103441 RepID=UPI00041CD152|nr:hypothetical protein [Pseudonocardia spinosispora]
MSKTMIVQYRTHPETAEQNQRLVENVMAELSAGNPGGVRYAAFRLGDGVSFIHVVTLDGDANPLADSPAFAEFQQGAESRLDGPPEPKPAQLIGSYRFLTS